MPTTVNVVNVVTGGMETITLCSDNLVEMFGDVEYICECELDTVNMMLYLKDWYNISDSGYHELQSMQRNAKAVQT